MQSEWCSKAWCRRRQNHQAGVRMVSKFFCCFLRAHTPPLAFFIFVFGNRRISFSHLGKVAENPMVQIGSTWSPIHTNGCVPTRDERDVVGRKQVTHYIPDDLLLELAPLVQSKSRTRHLRLVQSVLGYYHITHQCPPPPLAGTFCE